MKTQSSHLKEREIEEGEEVEDLNLVSGLELMDSSKSA